MVEEVEEDGLVMERVKGRWKEVTAPVERSVRKAARPNFIFKSVIVE